MITFRVAAASDVGLVRANNEDSGFASPNLLVLADGMGGAAAGEVASAISVSHLRKLDGQHAPGDLVPLLRSAVEDAQADILERVAATPAMAGMGTTTIALLRSGDTLALVHIGDSRAYRFRDDHLQQMTKDHTLVQYLVDLGKITPEEAENHPQRNVIMRALGDLEGDIELDQSSPELRVGDRWLLCSDGLFNVVRPATIEQAMRTIPSLEELRDHLIDLALAGGAPDNVTVVLGDVVDEEPGAHESAPVLVGSAAERPNIDEEPPRASSPRSRAAYVDVTETFPRINAPLADEGPADGGVEGGGTADGGVANGGSANHGPADRERDGRVADGAADRRTADRERANTARPTFAPEHAPQDEAMSPRRTRFATLFAIVTTLVLLAGVLIGTYAWSQTRYFVSPAGDRVAVYQGVPQTIGSWSFSHIDTVTDLRVSGLAPVAQDRLKDPVVRASRRDAFAFVDTLRNDLATEPNPSPSPSGSASASPAPSGASAAPSSNPSPKPGATK